MNKINNTALFITGCIISSMVVWKLTKEKYEKIVQEEIDSIRKLYRDIDKQKEELVVKKSNLSSTLDECTELDTAKKMIDYCGYNSYTEKIENRPYIIREDEFDEKEDYDIIGLIYYRDGILTDDDNNKLVNDNDISRLLLNCFNDEVDAFYIRDDVRKCDYEILADASLYSEIVKH